MSESRKNKTESYMSIEDILPVSIIQNIISFNPSADTRTVSKIFKKCYDQNQRNITRKIKLEIISYISPNHNNKTWIVDQNRKALNDDEKSFGYFGPISSLKQAIFVCKSGDTILLNDGNYALNEDLNLNLQIIGNGDNVSIALDRWDTYMYINSKLYFKNVLLDFRKHCCAGLRLTQNEMLWMDNCKVEFWVNAIDVFAQASVSVRNCTFVGELGSGASIEAITISGEAKNALISECIFTECGDNGNVSCIMIKSRSRPAVQLKLIGNKFKNNCGIPILHEYSPGSYKPIERSNHVFAMNRLDMNNKQDILDVFCVS